MWAWKLKKRRKTQKKKKKKVQTKKLQQQQLMYQQQSWNSTEQEHVSQTPRWLAPTFNPLTYKYASALNSNVRNAVQPCDTTDTGRASVIMMSK